MFDKVKQLSKETLLYGTSTILGRFLNFILVPFYSNIFPPDEYGIVANIYAYMAVLNIIFIYGLDAAYLKLGSLPELRDKKETFSTAFFSVFGSSLLFILFLFLGKSGLINFLNSSGDQSLQTAYSTYLNYTFFILALDALAVLPFIWLRLQNRVIVFSVIKIINIVINVSLNLILILHLDWGIEAIFVSNLAASVATLLILAPLIAKNLALRFSGMIYKRLLKFGIPFLPGGLAAMLISVIDKPIVERLAGLEELGIYQVNYKLGIFMMLFVSMFRYAWQPFFLQHAYDDDAKALFAKVFTVFTLVGSLLTVFISLFIEDIVRIKFFGAFTIIGSEYWGGLDIVPIILLGYLFNGFYVNFMAGLYIKEKSLPLPLIMAIAALANIGLNYLLIPHLGITGAALACLASYIIMAVGFFFVSQKVYPLPYEYRKIVAVFGALAVVAVVYYSYIIPQGAELLPKIVLFVGFLLLIFIFRAVEKKEIVSLFRRFAKRKDSK